MRPYADTNFFTRLYLPLEESPHADGLLTSARSEGAQRLPIVWFHRVELVNALLDEHGTGEKERQGQRQP